MPKRREDNLIPNSQRTPSELKAMTSKGGKRSGEVRRQRKTQREQLELLLSLPIKNTKIKQQIIDTMGLTEEQIDNQMAMNVAMFKLILSGGKGSVQAYNTITDIIGDRDAEKKELENKRLKAEIKRLELEQEKLKQELGQGKDSYEDLTPLADKMKLTPEEIELLKGDIE